MKTWFPEYALTSLAARTIFNISELTHIQGFRQLLQHPLTRGGAHQS